MNARTLMITAGAVVALTAPAVANAKIAPAKVPAKHAAKKHVAKPALTRQGHSRQIYLYFPGPAGAVAAPSLQQSQEDYNADLIAHGLDPVTFPESSTASETATDGTAVATTDSSEPAAVSIADTSASSTSSASTVDSSTTDDDWEDC